MKNRTLTIIFLACVILFAATKLFRGHRENSFDPVLTTVDTAKVDHIKFMSGGAQPEEFELKKNGDSWNAIQGTKTIAAPINNVKSTINQLAELVAARVLTKDANKYPEYEITEQQAARVIAWQGNKQVADIWIGGFKFDQAARSASSYVRVAKKPEVYLVDGFVGMSLKQKFSQYRDRKLLKADANDLTRIDWMSSAGKKQSIAKEDGIWNYAGMEAVDSTKMKSYLTGLTGSQGSEFSEITSEEGLTLIEKLTVSGNNMTEPTIISAYSNSDKAKPFLIHSSINPDGFFLSDSVGIYKRIFGDLRQFWPDGK
jgi:hypothetical protein